MVQYKVSLILEGPRVECGVSVLKRMLKRVVAMEGEEHAYLGVSIYGTPVFEEIVQPPTTFGYGSRFRSPEIDGVADAADYIVALVDGRCVLVNITNGRMFRSYGGLSTLAADLAEFDPEWTLIYRGMPGPGAVWWTGPKELV